ncbi:janus kinase and microtubule-interacting protein 3 isoform X2 [Periplaneta americana]|uniref:janus kinase and microtubule-interacting protein 3 isoform X2 n=1 Tax=Periplaneta americana TaxID=6978 RepID=UPI0037E78E6C
MEAPAASNTKVTAALREELATVRAALANERSACRALQRDRAAEIRAVREEEGRRRRDALCDLRSRLERDHEDALQRQKDAVKKTLDAEMLRELKAKDAELRHLLGEAHAREEALKLELRDAVRAARDTGSHEQQQQEHGGDAHRLQQEVTTLRERNRQLEERLELVVQADREKTAELRSQHEEHQHQLLQLTRTTQQEAHRLLEELRSKERALVQLQRRLDVQNERCDELLERRARESDSSEEKGMKKASGTHAQDKKQVIRRLRDMEGGRQKAQKRDDPSATPVQMVAPAEPEPSSDPELELEQLRSEIEERDRTIARLRQAAKEKDRKLDHLTNRHRKEQQSQLHKLFTELEPVAELEEEEDEDEEDSGAGEDSPASSGSPSLSPQPWAELYSCLLELQRENQFLQTRLRKAQAEPSRVRLRLEHELASTRTQVRELRKKLAEAAALEAEAHDLREQNELLEFRVLELQESEACTHTDGDGDVDVRARLLELAKTAPSPAERARLQQALALLDGQDAADAPRRIVATVLPFTSDADTDADGEVDELRRTLKNAECLQESGIFEEAEVATRSTQTELGVESTDLSAEIQKLTQFRERVERGRGGGDERLQLLEDKARLQAQVERLAADNRRLDEERCELEEAENDARLKYQQLEGKLATLNERRAALQTLLQTERGAMSRLRESLSESERKQQEAKERMRCLELLLRRYETRNTELEERESAVRGRLELLQRSVPALLVWSMWRAVQDRSEVATQSEAELRRRVQELECKERAYMETLRQADDLWADVEDSYKSRVAGAEEREAALRTRLEDSETRLRHATRRGEDAQGLLERLQGVEAGERAAQDRARRLEAERGRLLEETDTLRRALDAAQAELERMRGLVDGPLREELRRERARSETLQGEVRALERDQREQTAAHDAQLKSLKAQLGRTSRDLVDLECTNGELKEEVDTLEAKVSELKAVIDEQKQNEEKLVISMSQTILQKEQELEEAKREMRYSQMPSAHEELKKAGGVAGAEEPKKVLPVKPCGCKCMCGAEPSVSKVLSHKPVLKRWLQPQHWRQC